MDTIASGTFNAAETRFLQEWDALGISRADCFSFLASLRESDWDQEDQESIMEEYTDKIRRRTGIR